MKRKLLLSSAVIPTLLASGAMGQVINFHDVNNGQPVTPAANFNIGDYYEELFAGQGAYSDPGNNIWNGYFDEGAACYGSTYVYSGSPGTGVWPEPAGNPGNPYAAYNSGAKGWITSDGPGLFGFTGGPTDFGDSDSSGQITTITLGVAGYASDTTISPVTVPNGAPAFLFSSAAEAITNNFTNAVFTLSNVPPGTYGLYLYGAAPNNNGGTKFSLNSGNAHNGIAATLNSGPTGKPAETFVEGENFVIYENVTPNASSNIVITASPNPLNGVGNSNIVGYVYVNGFQLIFSPPPTAVASTAAQNVYAGDTANFSFSPAFATGATYQWQSVIGGVTNNLSNGGNISGATTTNLTIANVSAANVGLYQCVLTAGASAKNSPAAPLTILTSTATGPLLPGDLITTLGDVMQPGDIINDFSNNIDTLNQVYESVPPPFNMTYTNVEDNTLRQYVNLSATGDAAPFVGPVGIIVTPKDGSTVVTGLRLFTANTHPEDDPADYLLEGSNDGGSNFTRIAGGLLALPTARNAAGGPINITNEVLQELDFGNATAYTTYRLTFTNVVDDTDASNGVQIAEVQLLGAFPPIPPGISQQPFAAVELLPSSTLNVSVVASGPGPLTYQWYYNTTTLITGATNATYSLPNVRAVNAGNYSCAIHNPYGSTNSTASALTIVTATPYETAVLADNPVCYYPLSESSGTLAYEYIQGNDGTYESNAVLGQPGVADPPYLGFPANGLAFGVDGTTAESWVSAPFGSLEGTNGQTIPNLTLTCWINPTGTINTSAGLIMNRAGVSGGLDVSPSGGATAGMLGYVWNNNVSDTYGFVSNLSPPQNEWSLVALAISPSQAVFYMLNASGRAASTNSIPQFSGPLANGWRFGNDGVGGGDPSRSFTGLMNAVAVFPSALSFAQMNALYDAAAYGSTSNVPPAVSVPTNPITVNEGGSTSITATILDGAPPFSYQWYYLSSVTTTNTITGATNATLTLTNIPAAAASYDYFVIVSDTYGDTTSSNATLNVLTGVPAISPDLDVTNVTTVGATEVLSVGVGGTAPFSNSWTFNGHALADGGRISGATTTALTISDVQLSDAGVYQLTIANTDGSTPSVADTLVVITPSTYETGILADGPLAYYPLDEAAGGTNAYDIAGGHNGAYANPVAAVAAGPSSYIPAGAIFDGSSQSVLIPDTPALDFAGQITLEAWVQPDTNQLVSLGDIIAKGYDSAQNTSEMQMRVQSSSFYDGGYYNGSQGGFGVQGGVINTNWSHVVLTWDGANWNLYQNGAVVGTTLDTGGLQYFPDPWGIGDGTQTGDARFYTGNISGAAIYNYALTPVQVAAHYSLGLNGSVVGSGPVITITRGTAGSVVISWSTSASPSFVLQEATSLKGPWTAVGTAPVVVGSENEVTLTPTVNTFYNLVNP